MITSRAVSAPRYRITGVSSRRHAESRDYAEALGPKGAVYDATSTDSRNRHALSTPTGGGFRRCGRYAPPGPPARVQRAGATSYWMTS
jgi:hypothetical protein